ncbi:MotA/TolQ/ExbB proton channel family protein [Arhodomonas sp. SL1]|uniref:MotA/TolQ/ExbB proton channel family protein n=1 Tax=Arhodomonas sp. SL1 TaxID=3425691 RepID=UPI003F883D34
MNWQRLINLLDAGGPVVPILLLMSMLALTLIIGKVWQFRLLRISDWRATEEALTLFRNGHLYEAQQRVNSCRNPAAQALAQALNGLRRGVGEDRIREEVTRYARNALESLRSGLRPLEVIGSLAPLLGLFGTVLGMIKAFRELELAGSRIDPAVLSGGIWEALLTTAVGLAIAIPVIAALNWFERRVERVAHRMDDAITRVFTEDLAGGTPGGNQSGEERAREPSPRTEANDSGV